MFTLEIWIFLKIKILKTRSLHLAKIMPLAPWKTFLLHELLISHFFFLKENILTLYFDAFFFLGKLSCNKQKDGWSSWKWPMFQNQASCKMVCGLDVLSVVNTFLFFFCFFPVRIKLYLSIETIIISFDHKVWRRSLLLDTCSHDIYMVFRCFLGGLKREHCPEMGKKVYNFRICKLWSHFHERGKWISYNKKITFEPSYSSLVIV